MRQILLIACFILNTLVGFGQNVEKADLAGHIHDSEGQPMAAATVMLLQAADSVLTSFATTNKEGRFELRKVSSGEYLLKTTYIGYATDTRSVTVGAEAVQDLGIIQMAPAAEVLSEVEVKAEFVPLRISKDTIEYNAEAFKTQPNAMVEDLLKKLPGVEVDSDGNVNAQGEQVQNVLVDGKEFFGTDPKMATKNLPADAVDKVQVYDRMSDMAEFSGIDDGERQKTINLQLREDKKKGLFGNAEAGYGTDNHYIAKASINRFSKASQLSVLGMANNINQQGFSVNEYMNFAGGAQAFGGGGGAMRVRLGGDNSVPISSGLSDGLARTLAGGINYNVELGKKFDLRTNYFYNNIDNTITQEVFRQNFAGETFETNSSGDVNTDTRGHRFNLIAEYDIDSSQNLELRTSTGFSKGINEQLDSSITTLGESMELRNSSITDYMSVSDQFNFSGDLYYRKRFGEKRGRVLTANVGLDTRQNDIDGSLYALNNYYESSREDVLDQLQVQKGNFTQWYGRLSYTEPVGRNKWLEANYRYQHHDDDSDKDIFDIDPATGIPDLNDTLSIAYTRDLDFHRGGITFRMNSLKSSLSIGLQYQATDLRGFINSNENPIAKTFGNWLPSLRWRYEFASARSLRFEYTTSVDIPEIEQLSPIVDNSDPLRLYLGNPDLKAEFAHQARLMFHSFSQFSSTAIFGMLSTTYTRNRIITSKSINSDLVELQIPVNIDGDWRGTAYASYSTPLNFMRTRIRINGRVNYTNSKIFINAVDGGGPMFEESGLQRWSETVGLSFQNLNNDVYEFDIGGNWSFNNTIYESGGEVDQSYFTHKYYVDFTLNFLKNWSLNSTFDVNFYSAEQLADDQVVPLWSASVSRFVFRDKRGEIKLSVFDILNENRGINWTSTSNYIEEVRANSLSQYFMLSFIYSIKGYGQGAMPDIHMGRRMR